MNPLAKLLDQTRLRLESESKNKLSGDSWRLSYHLMPPVGWLNDPNGLCQFNGEYHVFFQYSPYEVDGSGAKLWGHYRSQDLVNWTFSGAPILPDSPWDCHGVYSGSTFVEQDKAYIFYTGNVKFPGNYDYINAGRGAATISVELMADGTVSEKSLILADEDYPSDYSCHIRDPKVWRKDDSYYMILGARTKDSKGRVLQYKSPDLKKWTLFQELGSFEDFGYMWECPDIFELTVTDSLVENMDTADDLSKVSVLSFSPQGLERGETHFQNIFQSGYIVLDNQKLYTAPHDSAPYLLNTTTFVEWDNGFDFYAPQTFTDQSGRQLLIAWAGLPDIEDEYQNPTTKYGWQHALTIPRVLTFKNGKIYQNPIPELQSLRQLERRFEENQHEINIEVETRVYELYLPEITEKQGKLAITDDLVFSWQEGFCTLEFLNNTGAGRTRRVCSLDQLKSLRLMADRSLLEFYLNDGEKVFTSRYYPEKAKHNVKIQGAQTATMWGLAK